MVAKTDISQRLTESRDRGIRFLLEQQRPDGAIGNPEADGLGPYYKALWALAAAGQQEAGGRLATWIAKNVLTEDGDFAGALRGEGHNYSYPYPNAWIICGAQKLGRFDISRRGMDFLMLLHHEEDGGFRTRRDD